MLSAKSRSAQSFYRYILPAWLAGLALCLAYWHSMGRFIHFFKRGEILQFDFWRVFYPMGKSLWDNPAPIEGYYYSPSFALLLKGFGAFSYPAGQLGWNLFLFAFSIAHLYLASVIFGKDRRLAVFYGLNLATSFCFYNNYFWGQLSELLLCLLLAGFVSYAAGRKWLAATFLSAAITTKYFLGFTLLVFVFRRDWKQLGRVAALGFLILGIIPSATLGLSETVNFYAGIYKNISHDTGLYAIDPSNQHLPYVIERWLPSTKGTLLPKILNFAFIAAILALLFKVRRGGSLRYQMLSMLNAALFLLSSLTPTAWEHYFIYLSFCQAWVLYLSGKMIPGKWRICVQALAGVSVFLTSLFPFFFKLVEPLDFAAGAHLQVASLLLAAGSLVAAFQLAPDSTDVEKL